ncbi:MAG: hypothetical protein B7Y25_00235 [Alphaproteobacteria bacterium 16-39-46]|nr:MAG: hypothetical protein B7Y25_00235 [Alphaproteobacteria bacterium 16-39-46]OZA44515.1 MAG: hypothetical protein B7X84_00085 [Alphaproteobacteria bacterium 17-39-52]HQS83362.1 class I SAM-dependent methyltransferase [Alphaproteobacteria bacterium]HQS93049.1 class I SAM-dependent methyltransferase [Alphaproteobacteria bacterium]
MKFLDKEGKLHQHYEKIGELKDDRLTAFDYNLRSLEIECAKSYIFPTTKILDVGSGPGTACFEYAQISNKVVGMDYAQSMVDFSTEQLHLKHPNLLKRLHFDRGSALELPYDSNSFDMITSHRVLIALLSWESQKKALQEITRCLIPHGIYVMFEATFEGLEILNKFKKMFNLREVSDGGDGDYDRLLFSEKNLKEFMREEFELIRIHSFGMYYFISRILQPLFVAPNSAKYDHKLNDVAFQIARHIPDFENMGHLKGYVWKKNG